MRLASWAGYLPRQLDWSFKALGAGDEAREALRVLTLGGTAVVSKPSVRAMRLARRAPCH